MLQLEDKDLQTFYSKRKHKTILFLTHYISKRMTHLKSSVITLFGENYTFYVYPFVFFHKDKHFY